MNLLLRLEIFSSSYPSHTNASVQICLSQKLLWTLSTLSLFVFKHLLQMFLYCYQQLETLLVCVSNEIKSQMKKSCQSSTHFKSEVVSMGNHDSSGEFATMLLPSLLAPGPLLGWLHFFFFFLGGTY